MGNPFLGRLLCVIRSVRNYLLTTITFDGIVSADEFSRLGCVLKLIE